MSVFPQMVLYPFNVYTNMKHSCVNEYYPQLNTQTENSPNAFETSEDFAVWTMVVRSFKLPQYYGGW